MRQTCEFLFYLLRDDVVTVAIREDAEPSKDGLLHCYIEILAVDNTLCLAHSLLRT